MFFKFYISEFCCCDHVNSSKEVKMECIMYLDQTVEFILSRSENGASLCEMSLM